MKKTVTKDMILLVKGQSSWSLYIDKNFNETTVFSIAHENSGASSSIFGDLSYYRRWLRSELKINPSIENVMTLEGKAIFTEKERARIFTEQK
ncbi:hypothetical protein ACQKDB_15750 [Planococcus kocurii]|uniref:hypothetical protein n=1 Tax=Planococcus kocurii TaxID=1374 RepID=UPI003D00ADA9